MIVVQQPSLKIDPPPTTQAREERQTNVVVVIGKVLSLFPMLKIIDEQRY